MKTRWCGSDRTQNAAKQFNKLFEMEGSELEFREEACGRSLVRPWNARRAPRPAHTILEHILLDTMYDLPSMQNVRKVVIDDSVVEGRQAVFHLREHRAARGRARLITLVPLRSGVRRRTGLVDQLCATWHGVCDFAIRQQTRCVRSLDRPANLPGSTAEGLP